MEHLDDDPFAPATGSQRSARLREGGGDGRDGGGGGPQRQILVRRLIALGVGVLFLILVLFGIRGCLDARAERGFENYLRDLDSIATQSRQLSKELFTRFRDPGDLTELSFEAEVSADRGTAQSLLQNVQGLDPPDELESAQRELELAFELRRDALGRISEEIATALGDEGSNEAVKAVADQMRVLLASDVLYARAAAAIQAELVEQDLAGDAPRSVFVPDPVETWLDSVELGALLTEVAGDTGAAGGGVRGLALLETTIRPGNVPLTPDTPVTVPGGGAPELEVQVQNQGESRESDVIVSYDLSGGGTSTSGETSIPRIAAGETDTATIPIEEVPSGEDASLTVTVQPVPGEEIEDNNEATYVLTFE